MNSKFSKRLMWLLLAAAFAVTAAGGCGGSSHPDLPDDDPSMSPTPTHNPDSPVIGGPLTGTFGAMLEERVNADKNFFGHETTVAGMSGGMLSDEDLESLAEKYNSGEAIVLHGAAEEHIAQIREAFGIDHTEGESDKGAASIVSAAEDDDKDAAKPELVILRKINGDTFQGSFIIIDGKNGGAVSEADKGDELYPHEGSDIPTDMPDKPASSDEEIEEVMKPRTAEEKYEELLDALKDWNKGAEEHAKKLNARRASATAQLRAAADSDSLTNLAKADVQTITWSLADFDKWKFPLIYQTITIYSCYSYDTDDDWHLIETSSSMNPSNNYAHWTESGLGGCNYVMNYTRGFNTYASHQIGDQSKLWLYDHLPQNMNNGYTHTDGVSYNVGGSIGFDGDTPTGSISGGVTIENSTSYEVHDYTATDLTDGKVPNVKYDFNLPEHDEYDFDYEVLKDASTISRTNFTSNESWIWKVNHGNAAKDRYVFNQHIQYWTGGSRGSQCAAWIPLDNRWDGWGTYTGCWKAISLKIPPTLGLDVSQLIVNADGRQEGDKPVKFNVLSGGDWTAACDQSWVKLDTTKGGYTAGNPTQILVQIDPNTGKDIRKATITVNGTRKQVGTITISQEGAK